MQDLEKLYQYISKKSVQIITGYPDTIVYHNIKFARRFEGYIVKIGEHVKLSQEVITLAKIGTWIVSASFKDVEHTIKENEYHNNLSELSLNLLKNLVKKSNVKPEYIDALKKGISELAFPSEPETIIGQLLVDGITADIVMQDGQKRLKKFYEELLLKDVTISRKKWYDVAINIAEKFEFHLDYCKEEFQPKFDDLVIELKKEKKKLDKNRDLAIKKELEISDQELKALKKNLIGVKGRDARGIQTVFRTMSKNHYTLNEMVDRKASIMITVNSIILSLVLGGVLGNSLQIEDTNMLIHSLPILFLTLGAGGSIFFAILSTRPDTTHGRFTEDQIRNKKGNLMFYGNYHDMNERDFQWAFLQMVNDQEYMYESMVRDLYYLGQVLDKKYSYIRKSLNIFIIGLALSGLSKVVCAFMTYANM